MPTRLDLVQVAINERKVLHGRWYAVVNDLIGGYSVATAPKPVGDLNPVLSETEVCCFFHNESLAQHIADLHNAWLDAQPEKTCVYCGSTYAVPQGWRVMVERTCDALPPAHVVAWQAPLDADRPLFANARILHECKRGVPVSPSAEG